MYLPWSYDVAMLSGTFLYLFTGLLGYETWKVKLPGGYSAGLLLEIVLYVGAYGISFTMACLNIYHAYREGTHKQKSFVEAMRPLVSLLVAFCLCVFWAYASPNDVLTLDTRCFFVMSGTLYANMSCRLIVAQMSNTRCELINHLIWPLALVTSAVTLSPSQGVELGFLYALTTLNVVTHLHYVTCVVIQMCDYLKIDCFRIQTRGEHRLLPADDASDVIIFVSLLNIP